MKVSHCAAFAFGFFFFLFCLGLWHHDVDIIMPGITFSIISFVATKVAISENF